MDGDQIHEGQMNKIIIQSDGTTPNLALNSATLTGVNSRNYLNHLNKYSTKDSEIEKTGRQYVDLST